MPLKTDLKAKFAIPEEASTKELLIGDYDYKYLCTPRINPWGGKKKTASLFYGLNDNLGLVVALVMGLQHTFAMIGGIVTPPLLLGATQTDPTITRYLVNAALICSGICTFAQVFQIKLWGKYRFGSGVLSVMGTSFTSLNLAITAINKLTKDDGKSWNEAYGAVLGTLALTCLLEVGMSFLPPKVISKAIPPLVSGVTVFLIGTGLAGSGMRNWGGGAFCANNYLGILPPRPIANCHTFNTSTGSYNNITGTCYQKPVVPNCGNNGEVLLPFGDVHYFVMGLSVILFLIVLELFGSPFVRNCQVMLALLFGCLVSALSQVDGKNFWDKKIIDRAPAVTFLWVETFPLSVYPPLILPCLITYLVTGIETVGDLTATREATKLEIEGPEFEATIQGGLLGDALNSLFAVLAGSTPNTTFSQNNGVIVLTRCGARQAGFACAFWLLFCGIIGKIGGFISAIPNCVLGGMTTFLFANVAVSGIKIMSMSGLTRRERFIAAVAIGVGVGVDIVPQWATGNLWPVTPSMNDSLRGLRDAVIIALSTGYCIGALIAICLNLIVPKEDEEQSDTQGDVSGEEMRKDVA